MHRDDNSRFLLYIEPVLEDKSEEPIDDELTAKVEAAVARAVKGTANYDSGQPGTESFIKGGGYRGFHLTPDCEIASSSDLLLPNGLITNHAAVHYVRWFRRAIPDSDMKKLETL